MAGMVEKAYLAGLVEEGSVGHRMLMEKLRQAEESKQRRSEKRKWNLVGATRDDGRNGHYVDEKNGYGHTRVVHYQRTTNGKLVKRVVSQDE